MRACVALAVLYGTQSVPVVSALRTLRYSQMFTSAGNVIIFVTHKDNATELATNLTQVPIPSHPSRTSRIPASSFFVGSYNIGRIAVHSSIAY